MGEVTFAKYSFRIVRLVRFSKISLSDDPIFPTLQRGIIIVQNLNASPCHGNSDSFSLGVGFLIASEGQTFYMNI